MNPSLTYLMDELCAGIEIYYTGRTVGQFLKTAFILCDDYSELISKLFLLTDDPNWTDKKQNNHFKNYHDVLQNVEGVFRRKNASLVAAGEGFTGCDDIPAKAAQRLLSFDQPA